MRLLHWSLKFDGNHERRYGTHLKREEDEKRPREEEAEEKLRQLLRMSGGRAPVPEDVSLRVKTAVHSVWRDSLQSRARGFRFFYLATTVAACALIYVVSLKIISYEPPLAEPIGIVQNLRGDVISVSDQEKSLSHHHLELREVLKEGSTVQTGESGRLLLRLLGGSAIRLDVNTRLRFNSPSSFSLDEGTVYVDSGFSGKHLALITRMGVVKDEGTQFEVRYSDGSMRIRVREGSVFLKSRSMNKTAKAGTQLSIDKKGFASTTRIPIYGAPWIWLSDVAPRFPIEGHSLMEFLSWVSRENGWNVQFADQRILTRAPRTILHGSIDHLEAEQMLQTVLPVCGLSYSLNQGVLIIQQNK